MQVILKTILSYYKYLTSGLLCVTTQHPQGMSSYLTVVRQVQELTLSNFKQSKFLYSLF